MERGRLALGATAIGAIASVAGTAQVAADTGGAVHCTARALTLEEIRAGATTHTECYPSFDEAMTAIGVDVPSGEPVADQQAAALQSGSILAIHYDGLYGGGSSISVTGSACDGGGISWAPGDYWDNRISSTRHRLCGSVKHWTDASAQGTPQLTQGIDGSLANLTTGYSNEISAIRYY